MTTSPIEWCGASTRGFGPMPLGPCVLRHGHDGPVHQDENGAQWTDPRPATEGGLMCPTGDYDPAVGRTNPMMQPPPVVEAETAALRQRAENAEDRLRKATDAYTRLHAEATGADAARDRWRKRAEQAEQELATAKAAFEHAIASTAADALEHRGCGMKIGAVVRRAEQAERERDEARAALRRSRDALAAFDGRGVITPEGANWDIPAPAEIRDAWRASLDPPEGT